MAPMKVKESIAVAHLTIFLLALQSDFFRIE
jgi:hypothetical protein